ncbi:MAG: rod shape-determining protein [Patescibacteria group bacterium]|nr:MAG: rod shape-determining protein [Patescibacteria group bacterium]
MNVFGVISSIAGPLLSKTEPLLIDLGSAFTRVYLGETQLYNEPTCLAVHTSSQSVIAFGERALKLLGKTPNSVEVCFPVLQGEIAHTQYLEYYLTALLNKVLPQMQLKRHILGLSAKVAIPSSLSPAKKTLLGQVMKSVGFTKVEYIESGFVVAKHIAAKDSKLKDICVLDIGAQKAEISIFSVGELAFNQSYSWGGIYLTEELQRIVRSKHHCVVGWHIAEDAKKEIGSVITNKEKVAIRGKDLVTQAGKTVIVDTTDIKAEFSKLLGELLDNIQQFISLLPSEVAVSVLDKGIYITGGTSQLKGIDQAIIEKFKCDVLVSTNPEKDVIIGLQNL